MVADAVRARRAVRGAQGVAETQKGMDLLVRVRGARRAALDRLDDPDAARHAVLPAKTAGE